MLKIILVHPSNPDSWGRPRLFPLSHNTQTGWLENIKLAVCRQGMMFTGYAEVELYVGYRMYDCLF